MTCFYKFTTNDEFLAISADRSVEGKSHAYIGTVRVFVGAIGLTA